jgi:hypothetical protein
VASIPGSLQRQEPPETAGVDDEEADADGAAEGWPRLLEPEADEPVPVVWLADEELVVAGPLLVPDV